MIQCHRKHTTKVLLSNLGPAGFLGSTEDLDETSLDQTVEDWQCVTTRNAICPPQASTFSSVNWHHISLNHVEWLFLQVIKKKKKTS